MAYQPFYIVNAQSQENGWETQEEKDREYMKGIFPQKAKEIQEKVEDACDRLEYEGSMMFDEYPDKLMIRNICERIYKEMQDENGKPMLYTEDEEELESEEEIPSMEMIGSMDSMVGRCSSCQQRPPFEDGPGFLPPPPPRPPYGGRPGFPPPPPQGGRPGFPPPRPPYGGRPGFPPPPPQGGRPGFPPPPQGGRPGFPPPPPQWGEHGQKPCSCPPGRQCRDCLTVLQNEPDWMRDMIEVLLYQEMLHRRNRRRRRKERRGNY